MSDLTTMLEVGGSLAAVGGGAAYLRAEQPAVYWSMVGLPLSTARLMGSYASVMDACGLTVAPSRLRALAVRATTRREVRPVPPRRGIVRPTSTGLRLRLRLAPGQEPADVAASAERLRHAWGVHAVYVSVVKPGVVELRLIGFDVLRKVRMPRKATGGLLKAPVALREDATAFVRDYRAIPHQLTLGATLAGKSMYLRHLIAGLAPQPVALVGIDCKRGVELAPFAARLSALATDPEQAAELLPALVRLMEDRYDLIKARQGIASSTPDEEITSDIWGLPESERRPSCCSSTRWPNSSSSPPARMRNGATRWSPISSASPSSAAPPASTWRCAGSASAPNSARARPCSVPSSPDASATA
jgi:S-DNA-T family DNA segregation ATPase FtsK/SpoIIIE